jgi:transcriptional regulator with XRE-family HTH domain
VKNERDWRLTLGWTLWQLADASHVERTRLSLIENGHVVPHAEEKAAIRRALLEETARKKAVLAAVEESVLL